MLFLHCIDNWCPSRLFIIVRVVNEKMVKGLSHYIKVAHCKEVVVRCGALWDTYHDTYHLLSKSSIVCFVKLGVKFWMTPYITLHSYLFNRCSMCQPCWWLSWLFVVFWIVRSCLESWRTWRYFPSTGTSRSLRVTWVTRIITSGPFWRTEMIIAIFPCFCRLRIVILRRKLIVYRIYSDLKW